MLHVSKQGIGAIASQLKIQPIKCDNMSRGTSYTETCKSMREEKSMGICFCSNIISSQLL